MQRTDRVYVTLNGLRGVAALSVATLHSHRYFGTLDLPSAALAVDMFFALSGFVLAAAYDQRFADGMTARQFMLARFVRLYPLYLLGTALGLVAAVLATAFHQGAIQLSWSDIATALPFSLVMLPTPGGEALFPLDGVLWSIFFELVVNAIWALTWRYTVRPGVLALIVLGLGVAFVAFAVGLGTVQLGLGWGLIFVGGVARAGYSFFLGVLLYRLRRYVPMFAAPPPTLLALAAVAIFATPLGLAGQLIAAMVLLPILIVLGSRIEPAPIVARWFQRLGTASYAIYVTHARLYLLSYAFILTVLHFDAETLAPVVGFVFLAALVPICLLLERRYDRPFRAMLSSISRQPTTHADLLQKTGTVAAPPPTTVDPNAVTPESVTWRR